MKKIFKNVREHLNKKRLLIISLISAVLFCACSLSGFAVVGVRDYKYDFRRFYVIFGEEDFRNTALTLKIDCYMKDTSIKTIVASRISSSSLKIDEIENRILSFDAPVDTYGFSFRICYTEDNPDWLKTYIFPVENNKCFYLNFTNFNNYQNSGWFKPSFGIEAFSYYVLPTIDLSSESNLDGVNCFDDLENTFGHIYKSSKNKMLEYSWVDSKTGNLVNANDCLTFLKDNSNSSYSTNPYRVMFILIGSLFPTMSAWFFLFWLRYEKEQ